MNVYAKTVIDTWGVNKTIQVIALTIATSAFVAFIASATIPNNPVTETTEKEN